MKYRIGFLFIINIVQTYASSYCGIINQLIQDRKDVLQSAMEKARLADPLQCEEKNAGKEKLSFPLFEAAETSALLVQRLLNNDAQKTINLQTAPTGLTPLMMAAKSCMYNPEAPTITKILLDKGADPNLTTNELIINARKTAYDFAKAPLKLDLPEQARASCTLVANLLKSVTH